MGRRSSSSRIRRSSSSRAGAPSSRRKIMCVHDAASKAHAAARGDRHQGRSGDARNVQQSLHVDRRADGRDAAEHRLFGQHQGAARLLLRGVRRATAAGRQRAAHAGASRLDGSLGRDDHPRQRRAASARATSSRINAPYNGGTHLPDITVCTPVFDERGETILFWVASRGHHADIGGISPGSMSPLATTIERGGRLYRQLSARRPRPLPRARTLRPARRAAPIRRAIRCRTSTTSRRRSPPTRRACGSSSAWSSTSRLTRSRPIWATCRITPTKACAA